MSGYRVYRNLAVTPVRSSPVVAYFTPAKKTSDRHRLKIPNPSRSCGRLSAECFRKKEEIKKKYRFYRLSPSTSLYKRCQIIKKKLDFADEESENVSSKLNELESSKQKHINYTIPTIVLTSPNALHMDYSGEQSSANNSCGQENRTGFLTGQVKMATPNTIHLLKHMSPLTNHKILGRGRFGCVIETEYKGEKIAVKVIDMAKRKLKVSIVGEQNALGLKHPNIVHVYSILWPRDCCNGHYCLITMECCSRADNLQKILDGDCDGSFIQPHRIIRYSMDVCRALHFLHSKSILHLDMKPKNILVMSNDICKICDFGTSIKYGTNINREFFLSQFRGTVQYCSPEILQGLMPTSASDVYSFGITMWQFLYRSMPYGNQITEESLIYRVVKDGLRPQSGVVIFNNSFEQFYHSIYVNCWSRNPAERLTTQCILNKLHNMQILLCQN